MIYDTNCLELGQILQVKAMVLYKTALISDTSHKFEGLQVYSHFWSTDDKLGVPMTLSGLIIH